MVESSRWTTDKDTMALKTVLKLLLSKYAPLSIEMQMAVLADQSVVKELPDGETDFVYIDNQDKVTTNEPTKDEKESERMLGLIHATKTLAALNKLKADNATLFADNATLQDAFDQRKSELL